MKKQVLPLLLLLGVSSASMVGCGSSNTGDANTLKILVKDAGFGRTWIDEIAAKFEAKHEGVKVEIEARYDINTLITSHISSKNNDDDLYIAIGNDWKSFSASGKFAELDSFLEEEVDGVKVKDKVADEFKNSIYFTKSNGDVHSYRLPWTSGVGGIFYNAKMFKDNGWNVPTTFEELATLCTTIKNANVAVVNDRTAAVVPFAYSGQNTDYFDYVVYDWWGQIVGADNIKEFLKYENADIFDASTNDTYAGLKKATSYWYQLYSDSTNYIAGSTSKDAATAQKEFLNGRSAMMFNGDWIYNELLNYSSSETTKQNFELGVMKTPRVAEATDATVNTSYITGEDQYIAIPASSKRQELAKEFIKEMISDEGCATFTRTSNAFLGYKADLSNLETSYYMKSMIALRSEYTTKFTNFSSNRMYLCNQVEVWTTAANRPFLNLLNGATTVDKAFTAIASTAKANWSDWKNKSK